MKTLATNELIAMIEKNGVISEKEINLLKRRAKAVTKYCEPLPLSCYKDFKE